MNRHRSKLARHVFAILLLTSLVATPLEAKPPKAATAKSALGSCRPPLSTERPYVVTDLIRAFDEAWRLSCHGTNGREGVVLIFRMWDGSITGQSQGLTNEYKKSTFTWNPAAIAIVHTHPNSCDPRPSTNDQQIAERYHVRMFTITLSGMYVYDPATRKISKVANGLAWLDQVAYPEGPRRWFAD